MVFFLVVFILLNACQFFPKEPEPIDFTTIDEYPLFETCDSTANMEVRKMCFEQTIVNHIQQDLDTCHFNSENYLRNTGLILHIDVKFDGSCYIYDIEKINKIEESLPDLQTQLMLSVDNLPKLKAAKKRGQYVTSRFMIPLYIEKE